MGKPSAPTPPDPNEVAGAQFGQNLSSGIGTQLLGMVNQSGPNGSLTYNQVGNSSITGPDGESYDIPRYEAITELSRDGQRINDNNNQTARVLSNIGTEQSQRLRGVLREDVDMSGLPSADPNSIGNLRLGEVGSGPSLTANVDTPTLQNGYNTGGGIVRTYNGGGSVDGSIANAGGVQRAYDGGGAVQRNIADAGGIQDIYGRGGDVYSNIAPSRPIQNSYAGGGSVQNDIAGAGDITQTYGTDFSQDRQRVEGAILDRMRPEAQRDRAALEARLASQGIGIGSAPYQAAMDDFGRSQNDARLGAILAGGQEQSRMTGLEASRAQFENTAQGQQFGQNATQAQFANQAQAQRDDQFARRAGFENQAQSQQFGQDAARLQAVNQAQAQRFGQNAAIAGFQNQAQAQRFGQNATQGQFANQAQSQSNAQRAQAAAFANQAQAQTFGQNATQTTANMAAQAQRNDQLARAAGFANQSQAQQNAQNAQQATFGNNALNSGFQNEMAATQFGNNVRQQRYDNRTNSTQQNNQARVAEQNADVQRLQAINQARAQGLDERFATRNQPLNEIAALLNGSQVQQPQFGATPGGSIAPVNYAGIVANNQAQQQANYQTQLGGWNGLMGGIGSGIGSLIGVG